jgi:hypothetical protein
LIETILARALNLEIAKPTTSTSQILIPMISGRQSAAVKLKRDYTYIEGSRNLFSGAISAIRYNLAC